MRWIIDGAPMTIIGVSPPEFEGLDPGQAIDFRFPLAMLGDVRQGPPTPGTQRSRTFAATDTYIVARSRPGITSAQAEQVLTDRLQTFLAQSTPSTNGEPTRIRLVPAASGIGLMRREYETSLRILLAITTAVADVDREVALFEVRTVDAQIDNLLVVERMVASLATFFGATGAALAALGVYGLLAFSVTTRRREIGIRMALGAAPWTIVRETVAEAGKSLAFGVLAGGVAAALVSRYTASLLFGVTPLDLSSFAGSILVITVVVAAAASLPARRAARLDPTTALRE